MFLLCQTLQFEGFLSCFSSPDFVKSAPVTVRILHIAKTKGIRRKQIFGCHFQRSLIKLKPPKNIYCLQKDPLKVPASIFCSLSPKPGTPGKKL